MKVDVLRGGDVWKKLENTLGGVLLKMAFGWGWDLPDRLGKHHPSNFSFGQAPPDMEKLT